LEQRIDNHERERTVRVVEIPSLGYGNPDAKISYKKQLESKELTPDVVKKAINLIVSTDCMKPVNGCDDGCIDGRPSQYEISYYIDQHPKAIIHEHARVAGGGYITSFAIELGQDRLHESADIDLQNVTQYLNNHKINCGAHTGEHKHNENTDCGANDKFKTILENALIHKDDIAETTKAILDTSGFVFDQTIFDSVLNQWSKTLTNEIYFADSTGESRFGVIESTIIKAHEKSQNEKPVANVKQLFGDHNEDFIIVNFVKNKTFSQGKFKQLQSKLFPELDIKNYAQTFVVDIWRIIELAKAMSQSDGSTQEEIFFKKSLYAGIIFQIATAATLTDGTLRNFIIKN
jgi:hypothetical protein